MDNPRQYYINNEWFRYPSMPKQREAAFWGRILEINTDFLQLMCESDVPSFELDCLVLNNSSNQKLNEVLQVNDIIFIKDNVITLLAPSFEEPEILSCDANTIQKWNQFIKIIKSFFTDAGFLELRTPSLVPAPGLEAHLQAFATEWSFGKQSKKLYLPTSPEFHLKRALVAGFHKIFELRESFRNEELSEKHQAEFIMLEWYRAFDDLDSIKRDVEKLLLHLSRSSEYFKFEFVEHASMQELFLKFCGIDIAANDSYQLFQEFLSKNSEVYSSDDSWDDLFHRIFIVYIEPYIGMENPIIVYNFPISQSALARKNANWSERFELYFKGMELANAFHELNDPFEQLERYKGEQLEKNKMNIDSFPKDEKFHQSLFAAMPPSGGIAMGVERLFMIWANILDIKKTRLFPMK